MWLLSNLRAAELPILIGAWAFLFVIVPSASVLAAKVQPKR